jgi:hypothetical protein
VPHHHRSEHAVERQLQRVDAQRPPLCLFTVARQARRRQCGPMASPLGLPHGRRGWHRLAGNLVSARVFIAVDSCLIGTQVPAVDISERQCDCLWDGGVHGRSYRMASRCARDRAQLWRHREHSCGLSGHSSHHAWAARLCERMHGPERQPQLLSSEHIHVRHSLGLVCLVIEQDAGATPMRLSS